MKNSRLTLRGLAVLSLLAVAACDDPFQVIEEITFDESLGIVLSEFTRLESGVYIMDVVVGSGPQTEQGADARMAYEGFLNDGSSFGSGSFTFQLGSGSTIPGFELGVFGMMAGGQRRIIIPPELGYGEAEQPNIPPGSVLVFDVELCTINGEGPDPDACD